jgi:hypothetical protein
MECSDLKCTIWAFSFSLPARNSKANNSLIDGDRVAMRIDVRGAGRTRYATAPLPSLKKKNPNTPLTSDASPAVAHRKECAWTSNINRKSAGFHRSRAFRDDFFI